MSTATVHDLALDEERRSPPVTLAEVLAACHELEMAGVPVTRRSVRDKLGRGSMTTIHNGVSQFESRQASAPPSIDLTQEDRNVIADLGARALAVAEGRVERILAQREAALQNQVVAANSRADDAVAAAEASIGEAQRHTLEALATSEAARQERDLALTETEEARKRALRLEGQLAQITVEKERLAAHSAAIGDELVTAKAQLAAETALRQRHEASLMAATEELNSIRADHAEKIERQAEIISQTKEALAAAQGRFVELQERQINSGEAIKHLEEQLSLSSSMLSQLRIDFAVSETALAARDLAAKDLAAALSNEQAKGQQLGLVLSAISEHTEAVRSLEVSISSRVTNE